MESDGAGSPPEVGGEHKKKFGLFRRKVHSGMEGETPPDEDEVDAPPDGGGMETDPKTQSGSLGSKLKQKKAQRLEKKERKEQRKDMKKNPQFDFIENNEPSANTKKEKQQKKREDQAVFNFTEDNKHLKNHPKLTRQMVRVAKTSKTTGGAEGGADVAPKNITRVDLEEFLLRHPMHRLRGTTWSYMHLSRTTGNNATEKMVFLAGGGVRIEVFFEMLNTLAEDFEVLAPLVPPELSTFEDYVAGIDLICHHLGFGDFHMFGVSFGGAIALHYASLQPKRLRSLVLSHVAPPNSEFGKLCEKYASKLKERRERERNNQMEKAPSALKRALFGYRVKSKDLARDVPQMLSTNGVVVYWKKMVRRFALDQVNILSKMTALSRYHLETQYGEKAFADLKCPILLMDSERRDSFGQKSFEKLVSMFPTAQQDILEGFGHLALIVKGHEVAQTILKWYTKEYYSKQAEL